MAIQSRRGKKVDFDPQKMLPGEWAVSIDAETENQIVWMCFRAGVVKRMGTYEDFREQISEITDEIAEEFKETLNEIKIYMEGLRDTTEGYKDTTKTYMDTAEGYKNTAVQKATEASDFAGSAKTSEENSSKSAIASANSADVSEDYSLKSKSYAVGTGGEVRPNDDSDCASFYYEQSKRIAQGIQGVIPIGTITFAELSEPSNQVKGYMFDVSDDFVSDERFKNGSGIYYGAGSNVIYTADGMWDVLTPVSVMGVKGDKEEIYRQGFVNLTPENIGAATKEQVEEIAGSIAGVNADFVGTKEELEAKIASGEVTDGMTAFLKGVDDPSGGGAVGDLMPNKALVSDADGNVASSTVTSTELEYLTGAKSNIQQQIDSINSSGVSDISDATVTFEEATVRENVNSGEPEKTLWGKAKKLFSDLKRVAFSNDYNDLDNLPDLSNVNKDFVGTREELDSKIEAGEVSEGTTIYLTDGGGGGSGGGATIGNLEPNKVIISDEKGKVIASIVGVSEINCLSGVTSNVQEQIGGLRSSLQTEITTLVNTLIGEKFAKATIIAETLYTMDAIKTWGVNSYVSSIGNWGFYRLGENKRIPYFELNTGTRHDVFPFVGSSMQYLIKNVELQKSNLDMRDLAKASLREEWGAMVPIDYITHWMPNYKCYNYVTGGRPEMFAIQFHFTSNTMAESPWITAFKNIQAQGDKDYTLPLQYYTEGDLFKYEQVFFRMTILNLFEMFSESFINDPKNGFYDNSPEGDANVMGGMYFTTFNYDHIPVDDGIKKIAD